MNKGLCRLSLLVAAVCCLSFQASADDLRVIRSSVFPGMGQLGDGQTYRGLTYMAGEILLITGAVEEAAKSYSYSRSTVYYDVYVHTKDTTTAQVALDLASWQDAVNKSNQARTYALGFGGAAVAWWAWNIVDAVMFAPKGTDQSLYRQIKDNLLVYADGKNTRLTYTFTF